MNDYLADIDKQAEDMFSQLVKQMAKRDGVSEQLKSDNPIQWVGKMNNIRNRVSESVNKYLLNL